MTAGSEQLRIPITRTLRTAALTLAAVAAGLTACSSQAAGSSPVNRSRPVTVSPGPVAVATSPAPRPAATRTSPHATATASGCDTSLWTHVYHPYRLHVVAVCKTVSGVVADVRYEPDGDVHIRLQVSPSLVNAANKQYEDGDLVLEIICVGTITQADAVGPCSGYHSRVTIPALYDTIRATGSYVLDADHGWMELHPVSRVVVTGYSQAPAPSTAPPPGPTPTSPGCYPKTSSGNCYEPGEFCSTAEHGETGIAGDGQQITCEDDNGYWRWLAS